MMIMMMMTDTSGSYAPINIIPYLPPTGQWEKRWGFDFSENQIPHPWGITGGKIPTWSTLGSGLFLWDSHDL